MSTYSQSEWVSTCLPMHQPPLPDQPLSRCIRSRLVRLHAPQNTHINSLITPLTPASSAKDQLTGSSVAIKKIMKPFSTPVLSKRTYRELKLLKHIQHENVRLSLTCPSYRADTRAQIISLNDVFISPLEDMYDVLLCLSLSPTDHP